MFVQPHEPATKHTEEQESAEPPGLHTNKQPPGADFDWRANQHRLATSEVVRHVFQDVPERIAQKEKAHLIMAGYTSDGQVDFVVCAVNERELHIRARQRFFALLRRGCHDLIAKIRKHARWWFNRPGLYLRLEPNIEVLEPLEHSPTIVGRVIAKPLWMTLKQNSREVVVAVVLLVTFLVLFFYAPNWAQKLHSWISGNSSDYSKEYLQGQLERIGSAALVTSMVTGLDLAIKYFDLRRLRPVRWNTGIEGEIQRPDERA